MKNDPLLSLPHIRQIPQNEQEWFQALIDLARFLRTPEGCPWDREQSAARFAGFATEEAQELVAAFEESNDDIAEELGDTLFTLLAAAAAAEEEGRFRLEDVLIKAHEKMIRRHDHVFGEEKASTPEEAIAAWKRIKDEEKKQRA